MYSHIFWDWNGTLFDDVEWCISVINTMLRKRDMKQLGSISEYQNVFCFPIKKYYQNVGFDFKNELFEDLAKEYIGLYHAEKTGNCKLNDNAITVLEAVKKKNKTQIILSASETDNLLSQMNEFNISNYFDEILGLPDIYAKSKVEIGLDYISRMNVQHALLIGDTKHDYEVANALGVDCLLIAVGHQSKERLLSCGCPVLDSLSQITDYLN